MDSPPSMSDSDGVALAAAQASDQVVVLAQMGLSLPALHVEFVRRAIDVAGESLLSAPPEADELARLQWADKAMAIQLAAIPHFVSALTRIAESLPVDELEELGVRQGT